MNDSAPIGIRSLSCAIVIFWYSLAQAQIHVLPRSEIDYLFPGKNRSIEVVLRNKGDEPVGENLSTRIYQSSSSISVPIGRTERWKTLFLNGNQSVIETFLFDLPTVRTATEFRVRFAAEDEKHLGEIKIHVLPNNLFNQLSSLVNKTPIGVLDPENQFKPLCKTHQIEFLDLENTANFDAFQGRLAIIGPFQSKDFVPENLGKRIAAKREKPFAIVWIQPPNAKTDPLLTVYLVHKNDNVIVVIQNDVVVNLAESAKSQLNLLRAAQLALNPDSLRLPETEKP